MIADVVFLHERGLYQTIYFATFAAAVTVGPIIAGPMAQYSGWRNFWWLNVGLYALAFLMCVFGFPETQWHHRHPEVHPTDKSSRTDSPDPATQSEKKTVAPRQTEVAEAKGTSVHEDAVYVGVDPYVGKGQPSRKQFRLFQVTDNPWKSIGMAVWIPWKLFAFPIVQFASFVVSWSSSGLLTANLTQSEVFAAPPYHFSPLAVGFLNFALLVGALIGLLTAGPLSDWMSMKLTRRNKGVREPEMRLPTMIPYVMLMILGNFLVAFGYKEHWSWKVSDPVSLPAAKLSMSNR